VINTRFLEEEAQMRRVIFLLLSATVLLIGSLMSCTFGDTATVTLFNKSSHMVTRVNFVAISGGETDNNAVTISSGGSRSFYYLQPGTYRMDIGVDGGAVFVFDPSFTLEARTSYPRILYDSHIPPP
jgi:hypothetical protein